MTLLAPAKSGLTGWVLAIIKAMQASNVDVDPILKEIGMDPGLLEGGYSRYSQEQISQLWIRATNLTDTDFGLKVAAEVRPSTFHVVGYAMNCSATLSRALHRFAYYCRLISDSATSTLTETNDEVMLDIKIDTGGAPPIYQTVDTILASIVAFLRWISGEAIVPLEVRFQHALTDADDAFEKFFGCEVYYGCEQNVIIFKRNDLEKPVLVADEELASLLDGVANRYLEARMAGRIAVRVRDILIARLPSGNVGKTDVAKLLNMTERTLLRRLKDEGTTFSDLLYRVRLELAFQLLRRRSMTIRDTAYTLGFSDEGTFSRAFKRWTGRRPSVIAHMSVAELDAATKKLQIDGDWG